MTIKIAEPSRKHQTLFPFSPKMYAQGGLLLVSFFSFTTSVLADKIKCCPPEFSVRINPCHFFDDSCPSGWFQSAPGPDDCGPNEHMVDGSCKQIDGTKKILPAVFTDRHLICCPPNANVINPCELFSLSDKCPSGWRLENANQIFGGCAGTIADCCTGDDCERLFSDESDFDRQAEQSQMKVTSRVHAQAQIGCCPDKGPGLCKTFSSTSCPAGWSRIEPDSTGINFGGSGECVGEECEDHGNKVKHPSTQQRVLVARNTAVLRPWCCPTTISSGTSCGFFNDVCPPGFSNFTGGHSLMCDGEGCEPPTNRLNILLRQPVDRSTDVAYCCPDKFNQPCRAFAGSCPNGWGLASPIPVGGGSELHCTGDECTIDSPK